MGKVATLLRAEAKHTNLLQYLYFTDEKGFVALALVL